MLAAGGTGGHLFPAFALAEELRRRGIAVDLMTDMRGDRYGSGFPARAIYQVPSSTLASRTPRDVAKTAVALASGIKAAFTILKQVKPSAVIGFGGYPTYPPLVAARLRRIPTAVHEQNAVLGRANKMLVKRATAIATSFERTKFLDGRLAHKAVLTGNPVRQAVIDAATRGYDVPRPRWRRSHSDFRRQPGGALFLRLRAAGALCVARPRAQAPARRAAGARGRCGAGAGGLHRSRYQRRYRAVLR